VNNEGSFISGGDNFFNGNACRGDMLEEKVIETDHL
jgi:hypothetical protein